MVDGEHKSSALAGGGSVERGLSPTASALLLHRPFPIVAAIEADVAATAALSLACAWRAALSACFFSSSTTTVSTFPLPLTRPPLRHPPRSMLSLRNAIRPLASAGYRSLSTSAVNQLQVEKEGAPEQPKRSLSRCFHTHRPLSLSLSLSTGDGVRRRQCGARGRRHVCQAGGRR